MEEMEGTSGSQPLPSDPGSGGSGGVVGVMDGTTEEGGSKTSTTTSTDVQLQTTSGGPTEGEAMAISDDTQSDKMEGKGEESQAGQLPGPATGVKGTGGSGSKGIIPHGDELTKWIEFLSPGGGHIRAVQRLSANTSKETGGGEPGGSGGVDVDGREGEVTSNLELNSASPAPAPILAALNLTPDPPSSLTLGVDDQHGQRNHHSMPSLSPSPSPSCFEWPPPLQQQPGTGPIPGGSEAMKLGNEKEGEGASMSAPAASAQEEEQGFQGRMTTPAQLTSADGIEIGKGEGQPENLVGVGAAPNIPTPVNSSQGGPPTEEQGGSQSQEVVADLVNDFVSEYKQKRNSAVAVVTSPWSFPPNTPQMGLNSAVAVRPPKQIPVSVVHPQNHPSVGTGRGGKGNLALTRAKRQSANEGTATTSTVPNFPQSSSSPINLSCQPKLGTEQESKRNTKVSLSTSMEVQKKSRAPRKSSQKQLTPAAPNSDLGLEVVPWTADRNQLDAAGGLTSSTRKCVICLRKTPFIDEIFKGNSEESIEQEEGVAVAGPISRSSALKARVLPHIRELIEDLHVHIPFGRTSSELGICFTCLDLAQRRHILSLAIGNRRDEARSAPPPPSGSLGNAPLTLEPFEARAYPNFDEIKKLRELLSSSTHRHFATRHLTDVDWNFIAQNLTGSASPTSKTALSLKKYIESGEKLSQLHCLKCKTMVAGGKDGFVGHMKLHHRKEPVLFPCDICGEEFRERHYFPHWISHFYAEECEECGRKFAVQRHLRLHRRVHKKALQAPVPVQNNPVQGRSGLALALIDHMNQLRTVKKGPVETNMANLKAPTWECLKCQTSFANAALLESHARSVHSPKSQVCSYCGKVLMGKGSLQSHVARHEGRRDHKCEVCNKEYVTMGELREHSLVHQTAKNSICGDCGKAFKTRRALKQHESVHSGLTPFACPVCDKKFRIKAYLNWHIRNHKDVQLAVTGGQNLEVKTETGDNPPPPTITSIFQLQPNPMMLGSSRSSSIGTAPLALPYYSMDSASHGSQPLPPPSSSSSRITKPRKGKGKPKEDKKPVPVPELQQINQKSGPSQPTPLPLVPLVQPSASGARLVRASIPQMTTAMSARTSSAPSMAVSASPASGQVGGAAQPSESAVNILLEDVVIGSNGERGQMVVRVDGLSGGPDTIFQMAPEQQSALFSRIHQLAYPQMGSLTLAQSSLFGGGSAPADPTYVGGQLQLPPTTAAAAYNGGMNWEGTATSASSSVRDMDWNWERNAMAPATVTSASGQDDVGDGVGLAAATTTNNSNQFYQFTPPQPPPPSM